jgi:hypothetical protein
MRTVTFSSDTVQRRLKNDFVCSLINTTGDPSAGSSCKHSPNDTPGPCSRGIGHQNVQCLFLTPGGEIFHAASGYLSPDDLEKELAFASETFVTMKKSPAQAKQIDAQVHARRLKELGYSDAEINQPRQNFFGGSGLVLFGQQNETPKNNTGRGNTQRSPGFPGFGNGFPGFPNGFGDGGNIFDSMLSFQTKRIVLNDQKFSIEHPLLPMNEFMKHPQLLVGNEKTSFMSVGSGTLGGKNNK